jgi:hypothetical protein
VLPGTKDLVRLIASNLEAIEHYIRFIFKSRGVLNIFYPQNFLKTQKKLNIKPLEECTK